LSGTYGVLGDKRDSLDALKKAIASGYASINWIAKNSDLDRLHDDPEFRKIVGLGEPAAS
jgi:hypothetical protein